MTKKELKLYNIALDIQDASNLTGIVNSMQRVTKELLSIHNSTKAVNQSEIVTLFIDKLIQLNEYTFEKAQKAFKIKK